MQIIGDINIFDKEFSELPFVQEKQKRNHLFLESFGDDPGSDFEIADRIIRCCKKSFYLDLVDEATEGGHAEQSKELADFVQAVNIRESFYQNQAEEITQSIHDHTVLVTFDGIKGAGKDVLAKTMAAFLVNLDPAIGLKKYGPDKVSEYATEGIMPELKDHLAKVNKGERAYISSTEIDLYMLHFSLGLSRLVCEKPPFFFFDRSHITSLTKSSKFLASHEEQILDRLYQEDRERARSSYHTQLEMIVRHQIGRQLKGQRREKPGIRNFGELKEMGRLPLKDEFLQKFMPHYEEYKRFYFLHYLIQQIKGKYVVPDLSVILLCDQETSAQRQLGREHQTGRRPEKVDQKEEVGWYSFFRDANTLPNALYLDTVQLSQREQFQTAMAALKERCEDKGLIGLARKITERTANRFYDRINTP